MSHMTTVATELREQRHLLTALEQLGFGADKVTVGETPQQLYGYDGLPRPEQAEIRIPRQFVGRLSNDLGFRRRPDGRYEAIISEYDRRRFNATWLQRLHQQYAIAVTVPQLIRQGWKNLKAEITTEGDIVYEGQRR